MRAQDHQTSRSPYAVPLGTSQYTLIGRLYLTLRVLSLDVVAGACICSLFLARTLEVDLPGVVLLSLAICVWVIYTTDHLLDALSIPHPAHSYRHAFHQRHFKLMSGFLVLTATLGFVCLFYVPQATYISGMILSLAILAFYLFRFTRPTPTLLFKEPGIALIFTTGLFLGPMSLKLQISAESLFMFVQFLLLALANLFLFSMFELRADKADSLGSGVEVLGEQRTKKLLLLLLVTFFVITLSLMMFAGEVHGSQLILLAMGLGLTLIHLKPALFDSHELYRVIGDGVFMLPLLILY